jgi:uncharacterized protein (DUF885 family)
LQKGIASQFVGIDVKHQLIHAEVKNIANITFNSNFVAAVPYRTARVPKGRRGEIKTSATKSKIIQASLHEALLAFVATLVAH